MEEPALTLLQKCINHFFTCLGSLLCVCGFLWWRGGQHLHMNCHLPVSRSWLRAESKENATAASLFFHCFDGMYGFEGTRPVNVH